MEPDSAGQKQIEFMTVSRMKSERGWTDGLIRKLLGEPDRLTPNQHYRHVSQMRLYDKMRIVQAENTAEFRKLFIGRTRRKRAAARSTQRRRTDYVLWAWTLDPKCRFPERLDVVYQLGHMHHVEWTKWENDRWDTYGEMFGIESPEKLKSAPQSYDTAQQSDLDRWAVNYLRHECTGYDDIMVDGTGSTDQFHRRPKPGIRQDDMDCAHTIIKDRVLHEIIRAFPELKQEAETQMLVAPDERGP